MTPSDGKRECEQVANELDQLFRQRHKQEDVEQILLRLCQRVEAATWKRAADLIQTIHPDSAASSMFRMVIDNALRVKGDECEAQASQGEEGR